MRITLFIAALFLISCDIKNQNPGIIKVNQSMLDSIKLKSDTNYSKPYRNADFVTSEYFINRKDSTVCQLMKDSSGQIRQILIARNNRTLFTAQYYKNGQL